MIMSQPQAPFTRKGSRESTTNGLPGLGRSSTRERARARPSVHLGQLLDKERSRHQEPSREDLVRLDSSASMIGLSEHSRRGRARGSSPLALARQSAPAANAPFNLYNKSSTELDDSQQSFCYDHADEEVQAKGPFASSRNSTTSTRQSSTRQLGGSRAPLSAQSVRELQANEFAALARADSRKTLEELATTAQDHSHSLNEEQFEMEIAPGYYVPFRNAAEVRRAVENDRYLECCCLECCTALVCVADCEHVICPDCNMVNPVFDRPAGVTTTPFGAGMGLKKEWINNQQR